MAALELPLFLFGALSIPVSNDVCSSTGKRLLWVLYATLDSFLRFAT